MSTWRPIPPPPFWKRWLPEWMHGPVKLMFLLAVTAGVVLSGFAFFYFMLAMRFDMTEVAKLPEGTIFYDRNGSEITAPGGNGRKLVKREDIPQFLVNSLRAREDARFFEHSGVDVRGLMRATIRNIKDRDFTQGASTLSMQLARNCFKMKQKSLHRKFLEIALTLRVEANYSKDEILTHYLNRIYFGAGADGIEQAARTYFGKTTRDLSEGECAMIVGIIRGPHIFSPFRNLNAAIEQRNQTLNRLIAMKLIDEAHRDRI
ncbi:MAG: biosynthetic peptidoglycan transglycosylase, partial [Luteolibacter sp.]